MIFIKDFIKGFILLMIYVIAVPILNSTIPIKHICGIYKQLGTCGSDAKHCLWLIN